MTNYLPGHVENGFMLVGSKSSIDCAWRPCVHISEEVSDVLFGFALGRTAEGRRKDRVDGKVGYRESSTILMNDYTGLCAEYAVAKYLGTTFELRYDPRNVYPDLEPDIQVRSTSHLHGGLIIRPHEAHKRDRHVLGILHREYVAIVGWVQGSDVVAASEGHDWWESDHWRVPGLQTKPMSEFKVPEPSPLRWL